MPGFLLSPVNKEGENLYCCGEPKVLLFVAELSHASMLKM